MARVAGVDLPKNKRIDVALQYLYGVGETRSKVVIAKLNGEFVKILRSAELKEKWKTMDFETLPSTPQEFTRFAQADSKRWAEAVRISGFKASE